MMKTNREFLNKKDWIKPKIKIIPFSLTKGGLENNPFESYGGGGLS